MDGEGEGDGTVGVPEVALLPVHLPERPAMGKRHLPEGGQRHQCGAQEEGQLPLIVL